MADKIRLNKYIAESGVTSRRKADRLIESGQVMVNGKRVFEMGTQIDPIRDRVTVEGKPIKLEEEKVYIMFFKPKNVLTSMEDPEGRPTVADFFEGVPYRVFPVGRLDWDSEGLLLLTNDGDFANKVMHPKEEIPKVYHVKLNGQPTEQEIRKLLTGVPIIGGRVKAEEVSRLRRGTSEEKSWYRIVIHEGKNRQIRKMFEKIGYDVEKLQRVAIGGLELKNLERGEYMLLSRKSVDAIFDFGPKVREKRKVSAKRNPDELQRKPRPQDKRKVSSKRNAKPMKAHKLFGS